MHEEVVIERKGLNNEVSDSPMSTEVIRILLNEEHVEFNKHKVNL